MKGYNINY